MPTPHDRNNILAGLFLFGALGLFIATSVVIRQISLTPRTSYVVRLPLSTGAQGITQGSFVHLGGQVVGEVDGVRFYPSKETPQSVDVLVEIDADIVLYENARVYLRTPLLGSGSDLNIAGVGNPDTLEQTADGDPRLSEGEVLPGRTAPPAFLADAGWGEAESQALRQIVRDVRDGAADGKALVANASDWWDTNQTTSTGVMDDFGSLGARARELGERFPAYDEQVTGSLERGRAFADRLDGFADQMNQAGDSANKVIGDVEGVVASIQDGVDANRPRVDETVLAAEAAAQTLRDQTIPRIGAGADEFAQAAARVRALIDSEAPLIRSTLANARLASDQFKLLTVEVRNQPWRLLIAPATKEIERQLLYDAARTYAAAVGDLRAASESLESLTAGGVTSPVRARGLETITAEVREAFERYQQAEQTLLDRLIAEERR